MRKRLLAAIGVLALATASAEAQSTRQLASKAKDLTTSVWGAVSVTARIDEHDLVIEFRVSEGEKRVRDSFRAYIDLTETFVEQEKMQRELLFSPVTDCVPRQVAACAFAGAAPLPLVRGPAIVGTSR